MFAYPKIKILSFMKTSTSLLGLYLLSFVVFSFSSCKKEKVDEPLGPIVLDCDAFKSAQSLTDDPDRAVDYFIDCVMDVEADVTVGAGVVIEFGSEAGVSVGSTGSFSVNGSSADPVVLRGENPVNGYWKGILFDSGNLKNKLHHVTLSHAGSSAFNSNGDQAAVVIWADTKLDIQNCSITQSGNHGISAIYTNSDWSISNSRIVSCENAPAVFLAPYLASFDGSNSFTGNANDYLLIDLATQSITSDLTWKKASVPYRVTSTYNFFFELTLEEADVTVEAGTTVMFEEGTGLRIDANSSLRAEGTASEPITFTGSTESAGSWKTIYFDDPNTTSNLLRHVNVNYAGADFDGDRSGILMRVNPTLELDHVTFNDIAGCSVYNLDVALNPNLTHSNLVHNNTGGTLCHQ